MNTNQLPIPPTRATRRDAAGLYRLLAIAFADDPMARWIFPPRQFHDAFAAFAEAFGGRAIEHGSAHLDADHRAAALWLPPGVAPDDSAVFEVLESQADPERLGELPGLFERMAELQPEEPHWYLPLFGVAPDWQGHGIGADLLSHQLIRCDRDGLPAYLEASSTLSVPFYRRHGFVVTGEIRFGSSPTMFAMRRPPRFPHQS